MKVKVKIDKRLSHKGKEYWKNQEIDDEIVPLVKALQKGKIDMLGSCSGHGGVGYIELTDGRTLLIVGKQQKKTIQTLLQLLLNMG